MPFSRPMLTRLISDTWADISSSLFGVDPLLRFSNLRILGKVLAGLTHLGYGYFDFIARQATPFTATDEYLEGWAGLKNVVRKSASYAALTATFTGTNGIDLPSGTPIVRGDGFNYASTADGVVGSGTVTVPIVANAAGAAGDADVGTILTLGTAIAGIDSGGVVAAIVSEGADVEIDDDFRNRMLEAYQAPPQGGSFADYIKWSLEVPGVTRAWCRPIGMGAGTVLVYVMLDIVDAAFGGFPQGSDGVAALETRDVAATGDQLAVANHIFPLQPVTAIVYVAAPVVQIQNFTIAGTTGWSPSLKAAVSSEIDNVLYRTGSVGGVVLPNGETSGIIDISDIESAIAAVPGTRGFTITVPAANLVAATGRLIVRGVMTWTP